MERINTELSEAEQAVCAVDFWKYMYKHYDLDPKLANRPEYNVWKLLESFQAGWAACKDAYKIND